MNRISTEELCRRFEQQLAAIRPLQAALRDKVLTTKNEEHRELYRQAELRLATAASQVHDEIAELRQHILSRGDGLIRESQFDRYTHRWQAEQDHAASVLRLPPDQEAPAGSRFDG